MDLDVPAQLELLGSLGRFYDEMPFKAGKTTGLRHYFDNPAYSHSDGILLHAKLRHMQPRVGRSGEFVGAALVVARRDFDRYCS
jgi:hypothetical protein